MKISNKKSICKIPHLDEWENKYDETKDLSLFYTIIGLCSFDKERSFLLFHARALSGMLKWIENVFNLFNISQFSIYNRERCMKAAGWCVCVPSIVAVITSIYWINVQPEFHCQKTYMASCFLLVTWLSFSFLTPCFSPI